MGYVPGFSNDIFISYGHLDDLAVDGRGWVSDFHGRLLIEVQEELGHKVQIWRDKRITGATDFSKDLEKQVRSSAMLVAILSPAYVNSKWCDWELAGFAGSRRVGDLWVDTKCRAIKIFKRPADVSGLRVLGETEGMKFFDVDPATDLAYEMEGSSDLFKHRLTDLGHDIGAVLRAMRKSRTVFVGTASATLQPQRERVCQELSARQYRVLTAPDGAAEERRLSVQAAVKESRLSVLFHDRAARADEPGSLASAERLIAMDQQALQIVVVGKLENGAAMPWDELGGAGGSAKVELLIEPQTHTLCHTVLQMLEAQNEMAEAPPPVSPVGRTAESLAAPRIGADPPGAPPAQRLVRVYLVCDRRDHPLLEPNRARHLRDHLLALGFEVKLPLAEDDEAAQFSRDNRNKLKQCDGVLLYWGTSRQAWFEQRLGELMQARGWRQGRAFAALGAYVAEPENPVKQNYETREVHELIKQFDSFDDADTRLVRFVTRLGQDP